MARAKDDIREERIIMEAIVDAYDSVERAMGWYYYLDGKLKFPFKARCRLARPISFLKVGEEVEVLGTAPEEECETEMFVWIARLGNGWLCLWHNCEHYRRIGRPKRRSAIGSTGWIAATSYEHCRALSMLVWRRLSGLRSRCGPAGFHHTRVPLWIQRTLA
jgi:Calcium binding